MEAYTSGGYFYFNNMKDNTKKTAYWFHIESETWHIEDYGRNICIIAKPIFQKKIKKMDE